MGLDQVKKITENVIIAFNKTGGRLLQRDWCQFANGQNIFHNVSIPDGAVSGSFVQGERKFGQEGFSIVSFFDKKKRIINRYRFKTVDNKTSLQNYSLYIDSVQEAGLYNGKYSVFSRIFRCTTFDNENFRSENLNLFISDIHKGTPKVTRAVTTYKSGGGNIYTEHIRGSLEPDYPPLKELSDRFTFSLEQFGEGIKHKLFKSKVDYSPSNGHFYTFEKPIETMGLTEEEITQLCADGYLPLKLHSGVERFEFLKQDVFENTGIPPKFPAKYEPSKHWGYRDGAYSDVNDKFVFTTGPTERVIIPFQKALSTLAHEARHKYQFGLIRNKALANPEEIELSKKFGKALRDKNWAEFMGTYNYDKDGLEIDAFNWEKEYRRRFYQNEAPISKIFDATVVHGGIPQKAVDFLLC